MSHLGRERALLVGILCGALSLSPVAARAAAAAGPVSATSTNATGVPPAAAPAVAPAPATGTPPDIIRLRDGGLLRGTIIELKPNDAVDVALPNGTTRKIPMNLVTYAGPVGGDPDEEEEEDEDDQQEQAPAPARKPQPSVAAPREPVATLVFDGRRGLTLHLMRTTRYVSGAEPLQPLCTAPCSAELPQGTYYAALSGRNGQVLHTDPFNLSGPTRVTGSIGSKRVTRIVGVSLIILGSLLGTLALLDDSDDDNVPLGLAALGVGLGVGFPLLLTHDRAALEARPIADW